MRTLLLLAVFLLAISGLDAQEGKPQYVVTASRSDTVLGQFTIELFPDIAPLHARNFDSLVSIGFYDGTAFHRVIPGFVIQGGDPNTRGNDHSTWGIGDPSQTNVPAEFNPVSHLRGILSAARSQDPNSATSQFFIVVAPATRLDRLYTVYGRVLTGMNIVDSIVRAPTEPNQFGENSRPVDKITMTIQRTGIDTSIPSRVNLIAPGDDTSRVRAQQELRWARLDEAILYEVQLSKQPDFSVIAARDSVTLTTYTARALELNRTRYYWRVRASNGGRRGEWSTPRSFTTSLSSPTLLSPANGDTAVVMPARLVWRTVPFATRYRVQVSGNIGFTSFHVDTVMTDTAYATHNLAQYPRLFWRVFAMDELGDSTQSARFNFRPATTVGIDSDADRGDGLTVELTRGGTDSFSLIATLASASKLDIRIVDASGRTLHQIADASHPAGRHAFTIATRELPSGTYFVSVNAAVESVSRAFSVVR